MIRYIAAFFLVAVFAFGSDYSDQRVAWWNDDTRVASALPKWLLNTKLYIDGRLIEIGFRDSGVVTWRFKK